jgi:hypothetical protein
LEKLAKEIEGNVLAIASLDTSDHDDSIGMNGFDAKNVTLLRLGNKHAMQDSSPRVPPHLVDCKRSQQITIQTKTITLCSECSPSSPGIPAPLIQTGLPNPQVLWMCNTERVLGVCTTLLNKLKLDHISERWCAQVGELHETYSSVLTELNAIAFPVQQLTQPKFHQFKLGKVYDFNDVKGIKIGMVSILGWNTIKCGLPKGEGINALMFAQSGFRVQSCTLGENGAGAHCIQSKEALCGKRLSPLRFTDCWTRSMNPQVELFGNTEDSETSQLWLNNPSSCVVNDIDMLEVLEMS